MADDHAAPNTPSDPTPFIRTYAKDVARLTGTQAAHVAPAKDAPTPGVAFDEIDLSQSQGTQQDSGSSRSFPQEVITVSEDDTVANLNKSVPETRENKRDEILSRLRSKVQESKPIPTIPTEPPTPRPFAPRPPSPLPVLEPYVPPAPEPVPPAPLPTPAPLSIPPVAPPIAAALAAKETSRGFSFFKRKPKPAAPSPAAANLHTFKSDFSDHIDAQKASTFSVLAAQSDERETRAASPKPVVLKSKKKSQLPLILSATLLVVLGIGVLGGAYWFVTLRSPAAAIPFTVPSLIFADEKVELPSGAASLAEGLMQVAQQPSVHGNVIVVYPVTSTSGKKGIIHTPQPSGPAIKQIFISAPDILLRNIDDSSTMGVLNAGNANAPFFILKVTSYERTFAGMLGWEPAMGANLAMLYPSTPAQAMGSSSAPQVITAPHFVDATVANHDVRILKDAANTTVLLYGYRDKQTLIIAKDEAAFTALLVRLNAANGN
ncbi:MAG: hypothetical protein JWL88_148 [Parcubacteria group bacterium]|nr:hypothetical protein [Parcubacteria group bacterium]